MKPKVKHLITPDSYIKRLAAQMRSIEGATKIVNRLDAEYINAKCTVKIGHVFNLKDNEDGFDRFQVRGITVKVKPIGKKYKIYFDYRGVFSGPDKEPQEGILTGEK